MLRVMCLYDHGEYGGLMKRSAPHFGDHGVLMRVLQVSDHRWPGTMRYGTELCRHLAWPHDVLLLQTSLQPIPDALLADPRIVLLERVDGAQLRASRLCIDRPNVLGVVKSYLFRDRSAYNWYNDRAHIEILQRAGAECKRPLFRPEGPSPLLSEASLAKLRVGYSGFAAHGIMDQPVHRAIDFDAPRKWHVHFAGTIDYQQTEVHWHRRQAKLAADQWEGPSLCSPGRGIEREEYHQQIADSYCVLCPWGWGEATYRDYEAMLLGAVMIKPDTSHVMGWPDVYQAGEYYVPCRPDFCDAHEKIHHVVHHWDGYRAMRERARKLVVDAWPAEAVAAHMARVIKELAG